MIPYSELRPCYTGETVTATITVAGTGSIAGWTLAAELLAPDGGAAPGTPTAVVSDGAARTVLLTLPAQSAPGEYCWRVTRSDDGSGLVVAHGVADIQRTGGRGTA